MTETIIHAVINFVISGLLGYSISIIKGYKKRLKEKEEEGALLKEALMTMFQSTLTNTYYAYESVEKVPDYVYRNWTNSLNIYEKLGGDGYIHVLAEKMKKWDFEKTDILK